MYTGGDVRLRSFALVLALLLAATPLLGVVCEMDCDQPQATSPACHTANVPDDAITLRNGPHSCDHDHTSGSPALLASASGRDSVGASVAVPLPTLAHVSVPAARMVLAAALHGPPGLSGGMKASYLTVLRI